MCERPLPTHVEAIANLDELGAYIRAILALSRDSGEIEEEDARAVNVVSCLAAIEWRKLDAAREMRVSQ